MGNSRYLEYNMINHILQNGLILVCNNYKHFSKEDIISFAGCLSKMLDVKGVVTIGWNSTNPQIYLNIHD